MCVVCVCYYFKKIQSLEENYVWDLVELLKNRRVAEREWVFRQKLGEYGLVKQYMATLVAQELLTEICIGTLPWIAGLRKWAYSKHQVILVCMLAKKIDVFSRQSM